MILHVSHRSKAESLGALSLHEPVRTKVVSNINSVAARVVSRVISAKVESLLEIFTNIFSPLKLKTGVCICIAPIAPCHFPFTDVSSAFGPLFEFVPLSLQEKRVAASSPEIPNITKDFFIDASFLEEFR
jgi:hypothetical protein